MHIFRTDQSQVCRHCVHKHIAISVAVCSVWLTVTVTVSTVDSIRHESPVGKQKRPQGRQFEYDHIATLSLCQVSEFRNDVTSCCV